MNRAIEVADPSPIVRAGRPRTFESFADPNFRWFFAALFGSFSAMNTQMFIRGWLVYELTGSFAALGVMSLANGATGFVMAPLGGVIADRVRQKKSVVQACQAVNALTALVVGGMIAQGILRFEHLVIAAFVQGASMNMMMPARQAMTPDIVGTERLMNAIALNTSGMNVARLLMPGLAGFGIAALGGGGGDIDAAKYVYFLMFALYVWAVVGLLFVRVPDRSPDRGPTQPILRELVLGLRYVWETSELRLLLAANFLMVFFSMAYFTLLPGFAKSVLDAGPDRLGLMTSISGIGALAGSLVVASLPNRRRGRALLLAALLVGVALIGFSFTTSYWLSVAFLVAVGAGQAARMSLSNALVQSYSRDEYRGRVMSIYMMEFSLMSLGIYGVGVLANTVGPQIAIGSTALGLVILVVGLFCFSPRYRNLQ